MSALEQARARVAEADRLLAAHAVGLHTLDPMRDRPTTLAALVTRLLSPADSAEHVERCADALDRMARAQLEHFPENLFWDFDYTAATLVAAAHNLEPAGFEHYLGLLVELQRTFGCHSPIRFRYVHDFICGLDWERFVTRDPQARAGIGPFDPAFLEHVLRRGDALRSTIERADDPEYPPIQAGEWRNPFVFSRLPEHELSLHRALAAAGLIPVHCWRVDATPDWRKPYTRLRLERARDLGIPGDYAALSAPTPVA